MQQNDALFQINLLNVSVYLVSVCSVAEQTSSVCIELLAVRDATGLVPLGQLYWWGWTFFLRKQIMLFGAVCIRAGFPMRCAEELLWHSERETSQRQVLKVGYLSRWVHLLVRFGCGGAEGRWWQQILPVLLEYDICDWEHSWGGLSIAYSAKCNVTKFLASLEAVSDVTFLSHIRKGRLAHSQSRWTNHGQAWWGLTDHLSCVGQERRKDSIECLWAWTGWNSLSSECLPRLPEGLECYAGGQVTCCVVQVLMFWQHSVMTSLDCQVLWEQHLFSLSFAQHREVW